MFTNIDAQIQAGNPPDVFRVPYYTLGSYAGRGQLLDLSKHVPSGFGDRFTPTAWAAVQGNGKPYGVPHHTDTSVILYDKAALAAAGVTSVPTTADQAWTWDELTAVAQRLRKSLPQRQVPVRLQLAGQRGHALAQPAVPGRRPVPRRGPEDTGHRLRCRSSRDRLQQGLLHPGLRPLEQLGEVDDPRRRHLVRQDRGDDLRRRLPASRRGEDLPGRLGRHVLAAQAARGRRLRRQRPRGHGRAQASRPRRVVPGLRHPAGPDARLLRRGVAAAHPRATS